MCLHKILQCVSKYLYLYALAYTSGVTTDPADPAMRGGGRGPMGAQNYGIIFSL